MNGDKQKILIVDDEPDICRVIVRILSQYETTTAHSAEQALELLSETTFDLIVTDIKMPGKSGIDLFHIIREQEIFTPCIFITGHLHMDKSLSLDNLKSIAFDCITKPFRVASLMQVVEAALSSNSQGIMPTASNGH